VLGFIVRRCLSAALVLVITSMIVFVIFFKGPTSPAQTICDNKPPCSPAELSRIKESMGLNDPITTAYGKFLDGLFTGREVKFSEAEVYDCPAPCFGVSFNTEELVTEGLKERYPATLSLALGGAFIYLFLGVFIGVMAARFRGTFADRALVSGALFVSAIPYYLVALLAWIYLTQKSSLFPNTEGYHPFFDNPAAWFAGLLLPWLVLGLATAPSYSRYSRGQMVETMGEDYMRTAVAKGQTRNKVIFRHGLRAAIVPVVTIFGLDFGALLGGTVFTETIFNIDGMGAWAIDSLRGSDDIPVVTATTLVAAFFIIMSNLVVDLLYGVLDPRVKVV
jgi:peptide/nickel transport system permease protein